VYRSIGVQKGQPSLGCERFTRSGKSNLLPVSGSLKQFNVDVSLQVADLCAERRLRNMEPQGGTMQSTA